MNLLLFFELRYDPLISDYLLLDYGNYLVFNVVGTPTVDLGFI